MPFEHLSGLCTLLCSATRCPPALNADCSCCALCNPVCCNVTAPKPNIATRNRTQGLDSVDLSEELPSWGLSPSKPYSLRLESTELVLNPGFIKLLPPTPLACPWQGFLQPWVTATAQNPAQPGSSARRDSPLREGQHPSWGRRRDHWAPSSVLLLCKNKKRGISCSIFLAPKALSGFAVSFSCRQ